MSLFHCTLIESQNQPIETIKFKVSPKFYQFINKKDSKWGKIDSYKSNLFYELYPGIRSEFFIEK